MSKVDTVLAAIKDEVAAAQAKLPEGFEDTNTLNDYIAYANAYTGRAAEKVFRNEKEGHDADTMLVKAAGILVSALVSRNK